MDWYGNFFGLVGCMGVMILILIFFDLASFYMVLQVSSLNYRDFLWGFLSFFSFVVFTIKNLRVSGRIVNNSWESLAQAAGFCSSCWWQDTILQTVPLGWIVRLHEWTVADRVQAQWGFRVQGGTGITMKIVDWWFGTFGFWLSIQLGMEKSQLNFHSLHHFSEG